MKIQCISSVTDSEEPPTVPTNPRRRADIKKTICKNIFSSPYFVSLYSERWLDTDDDTVRQKLKDHYHHLYEIFYHEPDAVMSRLRGVKFEYKNVYQKLSTTAYVDENGLAVEEFVFMCVVQGLEPDSAVKAYFVSQDYNVNSVQEAYPIVGRFVFETSNTRELVVEALADESTIEVQFHRRAHIVEPYYLLKRREKHAGKLEVSRSASEVGKLYFIICTYSRS